MHVWLASLRLKPARVEALRRLLSADEVVRAGGYRFARDQDSFSVARGLLRSLLGRYLGVEPGQLRFSYGSCGKPALTGTLGEAEIQFNLSHSGDFAIYCFSRDGPVGIDLEHMSSVPETTEVVDRFFVRRQKMMLDGLGGNERRSLFFRYWVRNEAYLKAQGQGLGYAMQPLGAGTDIGKVDCPAQAREDPERESAWSFYELPSPPGYAAALALKGKGWSVSCRQWSESSWMEAGVDSEVWMK